MSDSNLQPCILEIFSFGPCEQGVKTIKVTKTFLKTLENDARACAHSLKADFQSSCGDWKSAFSLDIKVVIVL